MKKKNFYFILFFPFHFFVAPIIFGAIAKQKRVRKYSKHFFFFRFSLFISQSGNENCSNALGLHTVA